MCSDKPAFGDSAMGGFCYCVGFLSFSCIGTVLQTNSSQDVENLLLDTQELLQGSGRGDASRGRGGVLRLLTEPD